LISLFLFILAITLMKEGARELAPLVRDRFHVTNPANSLGFGWLFAYVVMSGSPVAAAVRPFHLGRGPGGAFVLDRTHEHRPPGSDPRQVHAHHAAVHRDDPVTARTLRVDETTTPAAVDLEPHCRSPSWRA
jgi:hypothetical protein